MPLAERMRPKTLAEFVGQPHLLKPDALLSRLLTQKETPSLQLQLPSLILWGPPGSGKTTLAQLIAKQLQSNLITLSAVHSGVKELRQAMEEARDALHQYHKRTVLFIDEIHRFHKGQQDALLPQVEQGTVLLIGATTENPSFEMNAALLSRCKVLRLESLSEEEIYTLLKRALKDKERGLGKLSLAITEEALVLIVRYANGDARRALLTLETAAHMIASSLQAQPMNEPRLINAELVTQALQTKVLLYDKAGAEHYNVISAFIKSMRGSDPHAAVYWMARMLEAGEDPMFILRRMVIFAAEDVGCADPKALMLATSTVDAFTLVGLPEGVLPMSQLAIYLATAPKSNSALTAYHAAKEAVEKYGNLPVPLHLRDSHSKAGRALGHGKGYQYPHNFDGHYVKQQYLPDRIAEAQFYVPSDSGEELQVKDRIEKKT